MASLRVLVVGAGAVGQVYARHYQRGGAEVTLYVRERYRAEAARGFDLYRLRRRRVEAERLDGCAVVTTADQVAATRFQPRRSSKSGVPARGTQSQISQSRGSASEGTA